MKIVRTTHFQQEQAADEITESEIALAWMRPELERESQDHPGVLVRTATVPDGSRVTVVGRSSSERRRQWPRRPRRRTGTEL